MTGALYLDDDSEGRALFRTVIARGHDAVRATDIGMRGRADEQHLTYATELKRIVVTSNIKDFVPMHWRWRAVGRRHSGIIVVKQQTWSVGEQLRRLVNLLDATTGEGMIDSSNG